MTFPHLPSAASYSLSDQDIKTYRAAASRSLADVRAFITASPRYTDADRKKVLSQTLTTNIPAPGYPAQEPRTKIPSWLSINESLTTRGQDAEAEDEKKILLQIQEYKRKMALVLDKRVMVGTIEGSIGLTSSGARVGNKVVTTLGGRTCFTLSKREGVKAEEERRQRSEDKDSESELRVGKKGEGEIGHGEEREGGIKDQENDRGGEKRTFRLVGESYI